MSHPVPLKYVRTTQGFCTWPCLGGKHDEVAKGLPWPKLSAGFIDWDFDGRPFCHGRSESMNLNSMAADTNELRRQWGIRVDTAGPVSLSPAAQEAAREFGAGLDPLALEQAEPA